MVCLLHLQLVVVDVALAGSVDAAGLVDAVVVVGAGLATGLV